MKYLPLLLIAVSVIACKEKKEDEFQGEPPIYVTNYQDGEDNPKNIITIAGITHNMDTSYGSVSIYSHDSVVTYEWKPGLYVRKVSYAPRIDRVDTIKTLK